MKLSRKTMLGYPRDVYNEPLCRLCLKPKARWKDRRRRLWCSQECVDTYSLATDAGFVRMKVYGRDKGVCAGCGLDTDELENRIRKLQYEGRKAAMSLLVEHGFNRSGDSFWDADHIEPLDEGGGTGMENLQTLCQPCHKGKTAEQAGRKARQRKLLGRKHTDTQKLLRAIERMEI